MVRMHGHQEAVRLSPDLFRANTRAAVFCHIPHGTLMFGQSHYVPAEGSRLLLLLSAFSFQPSAFSKQSARRGIGLLIAPQKLNLNVFMMQ
jgi:hypothetical protein